MQWLESHMSCQENCYYHILYMSIIWDLFIWLIIDFTLKKNYMTDSLVITAVRKPTLLGGKTSYDKNVSGLTNIMGLTCQDNHFEFS